MAYVSTYGHVHYLALSANEVETKMMNKKNLLVTDKPNSAKGKDK
jgi:hypothetical protein